MTKPDAKSLARAASELFERAVEIFFVTTETRGENLRACPKAIVRLDPRALLRREAVVHRGRSIARSFAHRNEHESRGCHALTHAARGLATKRLRPRSPPIQPRGPAIRLLTARDRSARGPLRGVEDADRGRWTPYSVEITQVECAHGPRRRAKGPERGSSPCDFWRIASPRRREGPARASKPVPDSRTGVGRGRSGGEARWHEELAIEFLDLFVF